LQRTNASANLRDDLTYYYHNSSGFNTNNRLLYVDDVSGDTTSGTFKDQASGNYAYDLQGRMITDISKQIQTVTWTAFNKPETITRTSGSTKPNLSFKYDAFGRRIYKKVDYPSGISTDYEEWYVQDASGNELTSYKKTGSDTIAIRQDIILYAASRVGTYKPSISDTIETTKLRFFVEDHLGSVRAIVTGRKVSGTGNADIVSLTDYTAFGVSCRKFASEKMEYSFHGMKKDNDVGSDDDYTTEFRQYDSELGIWQSPDAMMSEFPDLSPYNFNFNDPVNYTDPSGLCPTCGNGGAGPPNRVYSGGNDPQVTRVQGGSSDDGSIGGLIGGIIEGVFSALSNFNQNERTFTQNVQKASSAQVGGNGDIAGGDKGTSSGDKQKTENKPADKSFLDKVGDWFNEEVTGTNADMVRQGSGLHGPEDKVTRGEFWLYWMTLPLKYHAYQKTAGQTSGRRYRVATSNAKTPLSPKPISLQKIVQIKSSGNLTQAGKAADKGGLTVAGRALQKHGSREGSTFPKATGNQSDINNQAEIVLSNIINHPDATFTVRHHARFGEILDIKIPGGQGARFTGDGKTFIGFIEP
jgi:RHS repeat-associated protein